MISDPHHGVRLFAQMKACKHTRVHPAAPPQQSRGIVPEMKLGDHFLKIGEWPSEDRYPVMNSTPHVRIGICNQ